VSQLAATLVTISLIVGVPVAADASPADTAAQRLTSLVRDALEQSELVAREKRRAPRNALAFWNLQVFACARLLSATGEKLANPRSR
jgi:predicted methyltransferase